MIQSINIERLRGIREGELNLTPLTILVGSNGSGKSTVLEALYIGAHKNPALAVGEVVTRRKDFPESHKWLFWKEGRDGKAEVTLTAKMGKAVCELTIFNPSSLAVNVRHPKQNSRSTKPAYYTAFQRSAHGVLETDILDAENQRFAKDSVPLFNTVVSGVTLVEPSTPSHYALLKYNENAVNSGVMETTIELLKEVIPTMTRLQLSTHNLMPVIHISYPDRSVPVLLAGDGIAALVHTALQINAQEGGVALIEEPEVHQHYRTMSLTARVIWAAIRRGIQIILTTHSLEFIDTILQEKPEDVSEETLTLVRTSLIKGKLLTVSYSGDDVEFARESFGEELR